MGSTCESTATSRVPAPARARGDRAGRCDRRGVHADWISALIIAVTIPLIPIFMALIGMRVQRRQDRQLRTLEVLSGHFLDVVRGLTTLKVFGRSKAQVETIRAVTDSYRRTTCRPQARLPLLAVPRAARERRRRARRGVGRVAACSTATSTCRPPSSRLSSRRRRTSRCGRSARAIHASAEGLSAADQVFEVLDRPAPARGDRADVPDPSRQPIVLDDIAVTYPDRGEAGLDRFSLDDRGRSGRRNRRPEWLREVDASERAARVRRPRPGLGEHRRSPHCRASTRLPGVSTSHGCHSARICSPARSPTTCDSAVQKPPTMSCGTPSRPHASTPESPRSRATSRRSSVSGVRACRSARRNGSPSPARCCDARPLLLLDEPTAHLDATTEARVIASLQQAVQGRTVILVTHRAAALALADRVVSLDAMAASR